MSHSSNRAVVVACLANGGIACAKIVGFFATGAASMLAEAIHSIADTGNQALLLVGAKRGRKAPNEKHPFGFGTERYFFSFVVAQVIFALGSIYAIYEGVHRLLHPHAVESPEVAMAILSVAVLLEAWSFKTAVGEARPLRQGMGWLEFIKRTKEAELPVVLLEDVGALFGLLFALIGITTATLTGDSRFDAFGSIAIGVLLGVIALLLSFEMHSLLIGEAADPVVEAKIRSALTASSDVLRVIHLRTVHIGPDDLLVAGKIEFAHHLTVPALCARIDEAEVSIRAAVPIARLIFLEPDVFKADVSSVDAE